MTEGRAAAGDKRQTERERKRKKEKKDKKEDAGLLCQRGRQEQVGTNSKPQ